MTRRRALVCSPARGSAALLARPPDANAPRPLSEVARSDRIVEEELPPSRRQFPYLDALAVRGRALVVDRRHRLTDRVPALVRKVDRKPAEPSVEVVRTVVNDRGAEAVAATDDLERRRPDQDGVEIRR